MRTQSVIARLTRCLFVAAGLTAGAFNVSSPAAHAGITQRIVIGDDSGVGVRGQGLLTFRTDSGSCVGSDCLGLLDGITVTFDDPGFTTGDIWEIPAEVGSAIWDIDLLTRRLTGSFLLRQKDLLFPFLDFSGGVATNRVSGASGTLVAFRVPAPATPWLFLAGALLFAFLGRRRSCIDPAESAQLKPPM